MKISTRRLVAVTTVALLTLAACGGDDDDDTAPVASADDAYSSSDSTSTTTNTNPDTAVESTADTTLADTTETTVAGSVAPGGTYSPGDTVPGDPATGRPDVVLPSETPTELVITDLVEGTGDALEAGDTIVADYVGVLSADGTIFDESYSGGEPISLTVGAGGVIPGWDQGLIGVKAGGRRQLDIPPSLAYGDADYGPIPGGSALTFVIDAIEVTEPAPPPTLAPLADLADCPDPDGSSDKQQEFEEYPPTCIDVTKSYTAEIVTNKGTLVVELDHEAAPLTVNNFVTLARYHYFDETNCHRIIPGFMAQCGDPTATGTGGPGYEFADELPAGSDVYTAGTVAMANAGANTNGSQFFIITGDATFLPPNYSVFGKVVEGLDDTIPAIDSAGNPDDNGVPPLEEVIIESVTITES